MPMASASKFHFEPGSWLEAAFDVVIGAAVGLHHLWTMVTKWWYGEIIVPLFRTVGVELQKHPVVVSKDGEKTLKVVGVGYGRTGTYSLALALDEMGIPTLHTQHLYENEHLFDMWTSKIFLPSIKEKRTLMGQPDLQMIVDSGYQGTADLPMALYFEQVMEEFPDCKFILTTRESSEVWFNSWNTLTQSITGMTGWGGNLFKSVRQLSYYLRWLYSLVNKDPSYLTVPFPLPDQNKTAAMASYEEHNAKVRATIPADKLLEYSVKEGWQPLCDFLSIDECPDTPFPRTNSARSVQAQASIAEISPILVAIPCIAIYFWNKRRVQRACKKLD